MNGTRVLLPAGATVTARDIARAERAANKATAAYSVHDHYCSLWKRDLTCPTCSQLWALSEAARRFWDSLRNEHTRQQQQMPAERVAVVR